ncbi:hypothetical protein KSX_51560 [Ktedonospora formicarum]|uniref:Uncharacterized protein n=1 Tax=Ktedonospora formicarum TaxID=2778364 RepID=A0A8J3MUV8_9CHLR|nr:hypothetical protein KSX_51560 [Ktedonospora formicarum]
MDALWIGLYVVVGWILYALYEIAAHISELLVVTCLSPVVAIVPFLCELLIRGIVKLVSRFVRGRTVA